MQTRDARVVPFLSSIGLLLTATVQLAAGQTTGGTAGSINCNNQARTVQIAGGWNGVLEGACTSFTITIGIATIKTPEKCPMGGVYYEDTIFSCGPASTGNHCIAQGFKVNVKAYGTGGVSNCPPMPTQLSFASWADAVGLIGKWINCPTMPLLNSSFDWSASVRKCPGVTESPAGLGGELVETGSDAYAVWYEDPTPILAGPATDPFDPLGPGPVVDPLELPVVVRDARATQASLPGVRLAGDFLVEFHDEAGALEISNSYAIAGSLAKDGRFLIESTVAGRGPDGAAAPIMDEASFDGANFVLASAGSESCNVYASTSAHRDSMIRTVVPAAGALVEWLRDPLLLPALPASAYSVTPIPGQTQVLVQREHHSDAAVVATTTHLIDVTDAVPVVLTVTVRAADGNLLHQRQFGDMIAVGAARKPMTVVDTWYRTGTSIPSVVTTLRLNRATALSAQAAAAIPVVTPAGSAWLVRS